MRLTHRIFGAALAAWPLAGASPVMAAGGAHVIDDAAVETSGVCHLENWATRYGPDHGLLNLSPACTPAAWPNMEIGAGLQHSWSGRAEDTTLGPTLKLALRPVEAGLGLGVVGGGSWSLRSGRLEAASVIVPMTLKLNDRIRVNFDAGWSYSRAGVERSALFYGGQIEIGLLHDLTLMAEAFQRGDSRAGGQVGLRWNPGGGRFDLDLLAGRRVDNESSRAVTLGLTIRH